MEETENCSASTTDEPEIHYRGIKAMPFVIGESSFCAFMVCVFYLIVFGTLHYRE